MDLPILKIKRQEADPTSPNTEPRQTFSFVIRRHRNDRNDLQEALLKQTSLERSATANVLQRMLIEHQVEKNALKQFSRRSELIRKVPNFWSTILLSDHPLSWAFQHTETRIALKSLRAIHLSHRNIQPLGYTMRFSFDTNPYFSNKSLEFEVSYTRTFQSRRICSKIQWKTPKFPAISMNFLKPMWQKNAELLRQEGPEKAKEQYKSSFFEIFDDHIDGSPFIDAFKKQIFWNPLRYVSLVPSKVVVPRAPPSPSPSPTSQSPSISNIPLSPPEIPPPAVQEHRPVPNPAIALQLPRIVTRNTPPDFLPFRLQPLPLSNFRP